MESFEHKKYNKFKFSEKNIKSFTKKEIIKNILKKKKIFKQTNFNLNLLTLDILTNFIINIINMGIAPEYIKIRDKDIKYIPKKYKIIEFNVIKVIKNTIEK